MTDPTPIRPRRKLPETRIDPYVVVHTWTRDELLRARGITPLRRRRATATCPPPGRAA